MTMQSRLGGLLVDKDWRACRSSRTQPDGLWEEKFGAGHTDRDRGAGSHRRAAFTIVLEANVAAAGDAHV